MDKSNFSIEEYKRKIDENDIPQRDKKLIFQYMDRLNENGMPIIFDMEHLAFF